MAVIGITFLLTLVLIGTTGDNFAIVLLGIAIVSFIITISIKKLRQEAVFPSAFLAAIAACLLFLAQTYYEYLPQLELAGQTVSIEGKVIEDQGLSSSGTRRYIIKTSKINGHDMEMKIRLSSKNLNDAEYYDSVKINNAKLYELGNDNKLKDYYKSKGVYIGAYTYEEINLIKPDKRPFYSVFIDMRKYVKETVMELLPKDEGAVLVAMQTGETQLISDSAYQDFKETGITHLFAISGLNTSIWSMLVYRLLRNSGVRRKKSALISSFCVFVVMALAAFTPSVMRAGIMMLIYFAGKMIRRESDSINSIGTAALLITITNPFSALNIGLLLSFAATLGIIILSPPFMRYLNEKLEKIKSFTTRKVLRITAETISISLFATLFTFPVLIVCYEAFSLVSPLSNLIIVNLASFATVLSGIGVFISAIPFVSVIKMPIFFVCGLIAKLMLWSSNVLADLPYSYVSLHNDYTIPWIIATVLLFALALIINGDKRTKIRICTLLSVNILLGSILVDVILNRDITKIQVANVESGTSVILNRKNHSAVLGCGGGYLAPLNIDHILFDNNTNKVDLLIIPGTDENEDINAEQIDRKYEVVATVEKEEDKDLNTQINMWNDVNIYCNSDTTSAFATLTIDNLKVLITFTPSTDISKIPKDFKNADILICKSKVPQGLEYNKFGIIIISDEAKRAEATIQHINKNGGNAISTGGSSVELKTRGAKEFSARRIS